MIVVFPMDEIKKAREKYLSAVTDKQKQKQLDSVDVIANADRSVSASETGCIPDVKCPKCGKKYVQFIDADSQTGVNSLRSRRDKRKGRTMCCAACGYKLAIFDNLPQRCQNHNYISHI